jgi:hypothetical protein
MLLLAATATAQSGLAVGNFWAALTMLGVGWNFVFIGATDLIAESFDGADRSRVQGLNDLVVFGTAGVCAFLSGNLFNAVGWAALNMIALPIVVLVGCGVLWLAARRGWAMRV